VTALMAPIDPFNEAIFPLNLSRRVRQISQASCPCGGIWCTAAVRVGGTGGMAMNKGENDPRLSRTVVLREETQTKRTWRAQSKRASPMNEANSPLRP
jgi:hypothetical protein